MLKGIRIYLRLIEKKDITILYRLSNEEKVRIYNTIPNDIQHNNQKSHLRKALSIINEEDILIGFITYKESSSCKGVYSIGITIGSKYWGRKYGEDSIKTLLRYLFYQLDAIRVELEVIKSNTRAIKCYKKCGFIEEGIKRNRVYIGKEYVDTVIMGILREEVIDI
ncbi:MULTISPECIES: GNAT family protein [unclassified Clostridium]|uniref:GNAT family N-acetyltransferase n=1 Tax=unclassified Clostridium TaxID=2614128 RepID=UPI0002972461|nr:MULTISPECIES: GNAT family protein [unclassified Clostridium]EKQ52425.1 MAG: acetyltransferase, ribosomal protein N-acetylase [Clostridium sp. Maddingley MBC34-26]